MLQKTKYLKLQKHYQIASTSKLGVKALLATAPKKQIYDYLKVFHEAGITVEDITFNCIGDYFEARTKDTDESLGAIVNIGHDKTDVSIFNKGIVIKNSIFNLGSKNVDNDISYILELIHQLQEN